MISFHIFMGILLRIHAIIQKVSTTKPGIPDHQDLQYTSLSWIMVELALCYRSLFREMVASTTGL